MAENTDLQEPDTEELELVPPDAETAPSDEFIVTRAVLEDLAENPDKVDALSPEDFAKIKPYTLDGVEWPEGEPEAQGETDEEREAREANEAAALAADAAAAAGAPTNTVTPKVSEDIDVAEAETSAITALREKYDADVKALEEILAKPEPEDDTSDEWRAWDREQRKASRDLASKGVAFNRELSAAMTEARSKAISSRRTEEAMSRFDAVSARHPEVKLSVPFKAANAEYAVWLGKLVAASGITEGSDAEKRDAAVAKYESDPEFAKTVPAPKDLPQLKILLEAHHLVSEAGGKRSLDGAVLEVLESRGMLAAREAAARTAAARSAAEKSQEALRRAAKAPVTAPVGAGGKKSPNTLAVPTDQPSAETYLQNLLNKQAKGIPLTPFETKYEEQAKSLIGLDPVNLPTRR